VSRNVLDSESIPKYCLFFLHLPSHLLFHFPSKWNFFSLFLSVSLFSLFHSVSFSIRRSPIFFFFLVFFKNTAQWLIFSTFFTLFLIFFLFFFYTLSSYKRIPVLQKSNSKEWKETSNFFFLKNRFQVATWKSLYFTLLPLGFPRMQFKQIYDILRIHKNQSLHVRKS
jgi:hypothetical protein